MTSALVFYKIYFELEKRLADYITNCFAANFEPQTI